MSRKADWSIRLWGRADTSARDPETRAIGVVVLASLARDPGRRLRARLTVAEARDLAEQLKRAADRAEGEQHGS